jgi:hypothetical protein
VTLGIIIESARERRRLRKEIGNTLHLSGEEKMIRRFRRTALPILATGVLMFAGCKKAEQRSAGLGQPPPSPTPPPLSNIPVRQNWKVRVGETVSPKDIAVSEKLKHTVVWEDPDDHGAKIYIVVDVPPFTWDPFPNRECPDAARAANPCRSGPISPAARGRKYTYHVFRTAASGTKEIDPTVVVDY